MLDAPTKWHGNQLSVWCLFDVSLLRHRPRYPPPPWNGRPFGLPVALHAQRSERWERGGSQLEIFRRVPVDRTLSGYSNGADGPLHVVDYINHICLQCSRRIFAHSHTVAFNVIINSTKYIRDLFPRNFNLC